MTEAEHVEMGELVALGALDSLLFSSTFFPKVARQKAPPMHSSLWGALDSTDRLVNIIMSRGWAKTSILRMFTAKRIAYALSRTILFIGASEKHSRRSLYWIRKQIEKNALLSDTFGLRPGTPWNDEELQILHTTEEISIWITGAGITSNSLRGINFDDYRPDLIVLDDVMNDENSNTKENIEKIADLLWGAIVQSLAPKVDSEFAKLVMLNTPQSANDICQQALKDDAFKSLVFGCWSAETENQPPELRKSAWPERVPTSELQEERKQYIKRNRLSSFVREKECKLSTPETSAFQSEWLQFFEDKDLPPDHMMYCIMVIDPVPPPSDQKLLKGVVDGDFEAITVLGRYQGRIYVLEVVSSRGHNPTWTVSEFFRMAIRWRVRKVLVETVGYQTAISWTLKEAMRTRQQYFVLEEFGRGDKRPKSQKISDGISSPASNRQLYVRRNQYTLIDQFINYSLVKKIPHDDELETVAIGCTELQNKGFNLPGGGDPLTLNEDEYEDISDAFRGAP